MLISQITIRTALGTGFIFLMTTLGAATVFFIPDQLQTQNPRKIIYGFSAGIMTAASIWSLLLPAMEQASAFLSVPGWIPAVTGILFGAAFLAVPDFYQDYLYQKNKNYKKYNAASRRDALFITAITLHNIPEGMAVGLACALSGDIITGDISAKFAGAAALALGIGVQNFPEGAAVALPCYQSGTSKTKAFQIGALSGIVEPIAGFLAAFTAARSRLVMPWLLSFAAGAMLYAVQRELSPRASGYVGTAAYLVGFLLMMTLDTVF